MIKIASTPRKPIAARTICMMLTRRSAVPNPVAVPYSKPTSRAKAAEPNINKPASSPRNTGSSFFIFLTLETMSTLLDHCNDALIPANAYRRHPAGPVERSAVAAVRTAATAAARAIRAARRQVAVLVDVFDAAAELRAVECCGAERRVVQKYLGVVGEGVERRVFQIAVSYPPADRKRRVIQERHVLTVEAGGAVADFRRPDLALVIARAVELLNAGRTRAL